MTNRQPNTSGIEDPPTTELWQQLYTVMGHIRELAPWDWMEETDIFGVQHPEAGELGFASIMGMAGEHYAVGVYLGAKGLAGFWHMQDMAPFVEPEHLLQIPQLQASFENRSELHKKDLEIIKSLGLKFRGQHAWPMFRSYRPGCFPWFLESSEAQFLLYVLEQTLDVAPRYKTNPSLLDMSDDESYLVRVKRKGKAGWEDQTMRVPPPEPSTISITMDTQLLNHVKRLPKSRYRLDVDVFMFPSPVQDKGERPYFPYMLLAVERQNGMVLGTELLRPIPTLEAMWGQVPITLVQQFARAGGVPQEIHVRSSILFQLLQSLVDELGFKLKLSDKLRQLDAARNALSRFMM